VYQITFRKKAGKELLRLSSQIVKKAAKSIDSLSKNPRPKGSKKLKVSDENMWRIRIGDYRVLYTIDDQVKIIDIRKVGHRKDIYD
jgi:mRNA interferase RelE/StbE